MHRAARWLVAFWAVASSACAAIEGLDRFSACSSDCPSDDATVGRGDSSGGPQPGDDGGEGSTGSDGPTAVESGDDASADVSVDVFVPFSDVVELGPDSADVVAADRSEGGADSPIDAVSPPADGTVSTDGPLPDGTVPSCSDPPDDSAGVFVSPGGTDVVEGGVCGLSRSTPCKTMGAGLSSAATAAGRSIVYVSAGTYTEHLTLVNGVTVEGGWQVGGEGGTTWTYACTAPETLVTIQAPSARPPRATARQAARAHRAPRRRAAALPATARARRRWDPRAPPLRWARSRAQASSREAERRAARGAPGTTARAAEAARRRRTPGARQRR